MGQERKTRQREKQGNTEGTKHLEKSKTESEAKDQELKIKHSDNKANLKGIQNSRKTGTRTQILH